MRIAMELSYNRAANFLRVTPDKLDDLLASGDLANLEADTLINYVMDRRERQARAILRALDEAIQLEGEN
jgi:hypothetical protein